MMKSCVNDLVPAGFDFGGPKPGSTVELSG